MHISGLSEHMQRLQVEDENTMDIMYALFSLFDSLSEKRGTDDFPGGYTSLHWVHITWLCCGADDRFLCSLDVSHCIMQVSDIESY